MGALNDLKTAIFDLETSSLDAAGGDFILTCAILPLDSDDVILFGNADVESGVPNPNDVEIAVDIREELARHDLIVGFNSHGFDLPFLNKRLEIAGEVPLLHIGSMDLMKELKKMFPYYGSPNGARLDQWAKALNLDYQKTPYTPSIWAKAIAGDVEAMAFIAKHNKLDVFATRELFRHYFVAGADE